MSDGLEKLGLSPSLALITPESECYRPPSWPPPDDWVVSLDSSGRPLSLYSDPFWEFSPWVGKSYKLWFRAEPDSRRRGILTPINEYLLRLAATWLIWAAQGPRAWRTISSYFKILRKIFVWCSSAGISAAELVRYPEVYRRLPDLFPNGTILSAVNVLENLLRGRDLVGFIVLDEVLIARLFGAYKDRIGQRRATEQTAYIPPRIWIYQLQRLRECLDDFHKQRKNIEDCFNFCVGAYAHNFGSLRAALTEKNRHTGLLPFTNQRPTDAGLRTGRRFFCFESTAQDFGIDELLAKWVERDSAGISVKGLSSYLTLVQYAGFVYIANLTLQRRNEVSDLRADCLHWETDPIHGRIAVICGPTTKTDPDSDARWPTSPSVQAAVDAMSSIARLRMRCAAEDTEVQCGADDVANPYLFHQSFEPWVSSNAARRAYVCRPNVQSYQDMLSRFPRLLDRECIRITDDDLKKALMFTPMLDTTEKFRVGQAWPFTYQQLRRTGAVNMFASGVMSDSSIQVVLKHRVLPQTYYYGRNYSHLQFNEEFEKITVAAKYEVMAKQIETLVNDRYVSPLGVGRKEEVVVNLVSEKDFAALVKAGKKGEISFRETRLGGCTKAGPCEYGGIESVSRCAGGDGGKPCRDAIFDREKRESVERQLLNLERQLKNTIENGPRSKALQAEICGLRNYLDVTAGT